MNINVINVKICIRYLACLIVFKLLFFNCFGSEKVHCKVKCDCSIRSKEEIRFSFSNSD